MPGAAPSLRRDYSLPPHSTDPMSSAATQAPLFGTPDSLPHGLRYRPDFLTLEEERALLAEIANAPFSKAIFQKYVARRRVVRYGEGDYPASYGSEAE